jgi:hypothetical protein
MENTKAVSFMEGITEYQFVSSRVLPVQWNIITIIKV